MPVDAHVERHDRALGRTGNARPVAPVDDRMRQREDQVADARRPRTEIGRHDLLHQRGDLGADAVQSGYGREEGVEQGGAHLTLPLAGRLARRAGQGWRSVLSP